MIPKTSLRGIVVFVLTALVIGCNTTPTQDGAVVGGMLGAASGAAIGHQSGKQGEGALIGAGAGALIGALIGDRIDERGEARRVPAGAATIQSGHYQTSIVTSPSGETYEERVWVPNR